MILARFLSGHAVGMNNNAWSLSQSYFFLFYLILIFIFLNSLFVDSFLCPANLRVVYTLGRWVLYRTKRKERDVRIILFVFFYIYFLRSWRISRNVGASNYVPIRRRGKRAPYTTACRAVCASGLLLFSRANDKEASMHCPPSCSWRAEIFLISPDSSRASLLNFELYLNLTDHPRVAILRVGFWVYTWRRVRPALDFSRG